MSAFPESDLTIVHDTPNTFELHAASLIFSDALKRECPNLKLGQYPDDMPRLVPDPRTVRPYHQDGLVIGRDNPDVPRSKKIYVCGPSLAGIVEGSEDFFSTTISEAGALTTTPSNDEADVPIAGIREGLHIDKEGYEWRIGWNCGDEARKGGRFLLAVTHSAELLSDILETDVTTTGEMRRALRRNPEVLSKLTCAFITIVHRGGYVGCTGKKGFIHDGSALLSADGSVIKFIKYDPKGK